MDRHFKNTVLMISDNMDITFPLVIIKHCFEIVSFETFFLCKSNVCMNLQKVNLIDVLKANSLSIICKRKNVNFYCYHE